MKQHPAPGTSEAGAGADTGGNQWKGYLYWVYSDKGGSGILHEQEYRPVQVAVFCLQIMFLRMKLLTLTSAVLLILCAPAYAQDLQNGTENFDRNGCKSALEELRPLAQKGDAEAQGCLGMIYYRGKGAPLDHAQAAIWFRRAAEQDLASAQYRLALMLDQGQGLPQNRAESANWFLRAANNGHPEAQFGIGMMHFTGQQLSKDLEKAASWFRKAAEQGHHRSQGLLGGLYFQGQGVPQDLIQSYKWFALASSSGDAKAERVLSAIATKMTPEEIAKARELAQEWIIQYKK